MTDRTGFSSKTAFALGRRGGAHGAALGVLAASAVALGGCTMVLGIDDHEPFPADASAAVDLAAGTDGAAAGNGEASFDAAPASGGAAAADGAGDAPVGPPEGGPDGSPPDSGGQAAACPATACDAGSTCCYASGAAQAACDKSCTFSYPVACSAAAQCGGSTCCATMVAAGSSRYGAVPPLCDGWVFEGSTCGACAPAAPSVCGQTFKLEMCASAADCPAAQPDCCRVVEGNPFTYCVASTMCLPP